MSISIIWNIFVILIIIILITGEYLNYLEYFRYTNNNYINNRRVSELLSCHVINIIEIIIINMNIVIAF